MKFKRPNASLFNLEKVQKFLRSKKTSKTTPYIMKIKPELTKEEEKELGLGLGFVVFLPF
jgi:hypothetical protein